MKGALEDKVAIVTGAGKPDGMGFEACRKLAAAGAKVILTDLATSSQERRELEERVDELRNNDFEAAWRPLDVTSAEQAADVVAFAMDQFGSVDILFNNAGFAGGAGPFAEISDDRWMLSWLVNVMGIVNTSRSVLPEMIKRGGGAIVNNASIAGVGATRDLSAYSASKSAAISLTKSLAIEYGPHNIRVNAVCPGLVWNSMGKMNIDYFRRTNETDEETKRRLGQMMPLQNRWATPDEVGDAVVYLASPFAGYVTGVALPVAGGLSPGL